MIVKRLFPLFVSTATATTASFVPQSSAITRRLFVFQSIICNMPVRTTIFTTAADNNRYVHHEDEDEPRNTQICTIEESDHRQTQNDHHVISPGQEILVNQLRREGVISKEEAIHVMKQVDRQNYIDYSPYSDSPKGIECGQTISAPHMHGFALDEMIPYLRRSNHELQLLDVGCGSGYLTAAMGRLLKPKHDDEEPILGVSGKVYGMDVHERLVEKTRTNIMKDDSDLLESGTVELKHGNGWEGWPDAGPFDAIHVGAAADKFPTKLANQLVKGGIMVIPIGPEGWIQYFYRVVRIDETGNPDKDFKKIKLMSVRYVPLIH